MPHLGEGTEGASSFKTTETVKIAFEKARPLKNTATACGITGMYPFDKNVLTDADSQMIQFDFP